MHFHTWTVAQHVSGPLTAQRPFLPNKPSRSPWNVRTKTRLAFDSQTCYRFWLAAGGIWEITVKAPIHRHRASLFGNWLRGVGRPV